MTYASPLCTPNYISYNFKDCRKISNSNCTIRKLIFEIIIFETLQNVSITLISTANFKNHFDYFLVTFLINVGSEDTKIYLHLSLLKFQEPWRWWRLLSFAIFGRFRRHRRDRHLPYIFWKRKIQNKIQSKDKRYFKKRNFEYQFFKENSRTNQIRCRQPSTLMIPSFLGIKKT